MEILFTEETLNRLRSRGISKENVVHVFAEGQIDVPYRNFRGLRQRWAGIGPGRLFVIYQPEEEKAVVMDAYWNPKP